VLHVHQIDSQDLAGRRLEKPDRIHGPPGHDHCLADRVGGILQPLGPGVEALDLAVTRNRVGEINLDAGDVLQGFAELPPIQPPSAARLKRPLGLGNQRQGGRLLRRTWLSPLLGRHLTRGKLLVNHRPQVPVRETEAVDLVESQACLLDIGPVAIEAICPQQRQNPVLEGLGIRAGLGGRCREHGPEENDRYRERSFLHRSVIRSPLTATVMYRLSTRRLGKLYLSGLGDAIKLSTSAYSMPSTARAGRQVPGTS
jgi:hypothetical protein